MGIKVLARCLRGIRRTLSIRRPLAISSLLRQSKTRTTIRIVNPEQFIQKIAQEGKIKNMANCDGSNISCGVAEAVNLDDDPRKSFKSIVYGYLESALDGERQSGYAFVTWSDVAKTTSPGSKLARHIRRYFPRTVVATQAKRNPNSGNYIKVWVWQIPQERFQEHIDKHYSTVKKDVQDVDDWSRWY